MHSIEWVLFVLGMLLLGLPNMDSKDVEEIFKKVLTDESQESSQEPPAVFNAGNSSAVQPPSQQGSVVSPSQSHGAAASSNTSGH